jgi:hypothetical protein
VHDPEPEPPDPPLPAVSPIAAAFAGMPGVVERLLAEHYADPQGYCHGCRLPQAGYLKWPCSLAENARQARELQDAMRSLRRRLHRPPRGE